MVSLLVLLEQINKNYEAKKPFVIFSYPDNSIIHGYFQKNRTNFKADEVFENAFVFAPFDNEEKIYYLPREKAKMITSQNSFESLAPSKVVFKSPQKEKKQHISLVEETIQHLKDKRLSKIVVSRKTTLPIKNINFSILLKTLFEMYPSTFRYLWFHPETGIWCGATPELLMSAENGSFKTMALAGTQPHNKSENPNWSEKERIEHQYVVDDITKNLSKALSFFKISKTESHRAGPLMHLKTDITGVLRKKMYPYNSLLKALHPTPAVCGTPTKNAKLFINKNEGYHREFYTGFLGLITTYQEFSALYVNLRCMKIENNTAHLFVGGGITEDSNPKAEWEETENKLQTMLTVLHPFL